MTNRRENLIEGITGAHQMRNDAIASLTNVDLDFSPGGKNLTLAALLVELGNIQDNYTQSLQNLAQDWNATLPHIVTIADVQNWFNELDAEMTMTLNRLTDDDMQIIVDRGNGVRRTIEQQVEMYSQALLIFFGKLVIYFRAMRKDLPPSLQQVIR